MVSHNLCYFKSLELLAQLGQRMSAERDNETEHMKDMLGYREGKTKRYKMDLIRVAENEGRKGRGNIPNDEADNFPD